MPNANENLGYEPDLNTIYNKFTTGTKLSFKQGLRADLETYIHNGGATEGTFYLTSDTHQLYIGQRKNNDTIAYAVPVNQGIITIEFLEELSNYVPEDAQNEGFAGEVAGDFYYVKDANVLCIWNGTKWIQINSDTTLTTDSLAIQASATDGSATVTFTLSDSGNNTASDIINITKGENIKFSTPTTPNPTDTTSLILEAKDTINSYTIDAAADNVDVNKATVSLLGAQSVTTGFGTAADSNSLGSSFNLGTGTITYAPAPGSTNTNKFIQYEYDSTDEILNINPIVPTAVGISYSSDSPGYFSQQLSLSTKSKGNSSNTTPITLNGPSMKFQLGVLDLNSQEEDTTKYYTFTKGENDYVFTANASPNENDGLLTGRKIKKLITTQFASELTAANGMVFKGTIATANALASTLSDNNTVSGHSYKITSIITAQDLSNAGITSNNINFPIGVNSLRPGDMVICEVTTDNNTTAKKWTVIPSADEIIYKFVAEGVSNGTALPTTGFTGGYGWKITDNMSTISGAPNATDNILLQQQFYTTSTKETGELDLKLYHNNSATNDPVYSVIYSLKDINARLTTTSTPDYNTFAKRATKSNNTYAKTTTFIKDLTLDKFGRVTAATKETIDITPNIYDVSTGVTYVSTTSDLATASTATTITSAIDSSVNSSATSVIALRSSSLTLGTSSTSGSEGITIDLVWGTF